MSSPRPAIDVAIQQAASATGVSAQFLHKVALRESSLNPQARASTSSAAGLFLFIEETWLRTLATHGDKHGFEAEAARITRAPDGRAVVDDPNARAELLNLRLDPEAAALMAGALTGDNAAGLRARLGRSPSSGEMYMAHVLGVGDAVRLINASTATPEASAAEMFPRAARANIALFTGANGRPSTVAELSVRLAGLVGGEGVAGAGGAADRVAASEDGGVLHSPALRAALGESRSAPVRPAADSQGPLLLSNALVQALASLDAPAGAERDEREDRPKARRP